MIQVHLLNMINKQELDNKIIYKPKTIQNNIQYKIIFKSNNKNSTQVQCILYANFINWIEFVNSKEDIPVKYNYISNQGLLISFILTDESDEFIINIGPIDLCTKITIKNLTQNPILDFIPIQWDNIFIINLPRRSDRKEQMIKKLSDANITNYEFIEAFDGLNPDVNNKFIQLKNKKNLQIVTPGHFACLLSHIKAIKLAKSRNYSNIMILEDDVFFYDNFINKISQILMPKFDMVYLGGIISKKKLFFNGWAKHNKIMGAYAYLLNSSLFDIVLNHLEKLTEYVDILFIKEIQPNYSVFILDDLVKTDLASSDTSHKSNTLVKRLKYIN